MCWYDVCIRSDTGFKRFVYLMDVCRLVCLIESCSFDGCVVGSFMLVTL